METTSGFQSHGKCIGFSFKYRRGSFRTAVLSTYLFIDQVSRGKLPMLKKIMVLLHFCFCFSVIIMFFILKSELIVS